MAPRKARVEGDEKNMGPSTEAEAAEYFGDKPKQRPTRPSAQFRAGVKAFQDAHPELWEELRLCPLQHGVDVIAEHLEKL